jgi:hypothetical protein
MATYTDDVITRFNILVDGGAGLEKILNTTISKMQQLESAARKAATQVKLALDQAMGESVFGRVLTKDFSKAMGPGSTVGGILGDLGIGTTSAAIKAAKGGAQELIDAVGKDLSRAAAQGQLALEKLTQKGQKGFEGIADAGREIGILMGLIFGGMTLQRWGLSILRFVIPSMEKFQGYTSEGTKGILAMQASMEFLKFSMFEAFTSTNLFRMFIDFIIGASNALSEFVAEHPNLTAMVATFGGLGVVLGSVGIIAGGIYQFFLLTKALNLGAFLTSSFTSFLSPLGLAVVGVGLMVFKMAEAYTKSDELKEGASAAFNSIADSLSMVTTYIQDLTGFTIDFDDVFFKAGVRVNLTLISMATGISSIIVGLLDVIDLLRFVSKYSGAGLIAKGFGIDFFSDDAAIASQERRAQYENNMDSLNTAFKEQLNLLENGRPKINESSESMDLLSTNISDASVNTISLSNETFVLDSATLDLLESSKLLIDEMKTEKERVKELADEYANLAKQKEKAGKAKSSSSSSIQDAIDKATRLAINARPSASTLKSSVTGG